MDKHKKGLVVVGQANYDNVVAKGVAVLSALAKEHGYGPKMETKYLHDVARGVEARSKDARAAYIRERFSKAGMDEKGDEDIKHGSITRYLQLGMHELVGKGEEGFRRALEPLVEKTIDFFLPPAKHPMLDGEFSCLLVIPPEWASLRSQFALLREAYGLPKDFPEEFEEEFTRALDGKTLTPHGRLAPREPYVLIGVDGGRARKNFRRVDADSEVKNLGLSYLLAHEYIQLLLVRPRFLFPEEGGVALGEKFSSGYLRVTARGGYLDESGRPELSFVPETANGNSFRGTGKPTYTKVVTL